MKNREERIRAIDRMHRDLSLLANIDGDIAEYIMRMRRKLSELSSYIDGLESEREDIAKWILRKKGEKK